MPSLTWIDHDAEARELSLRILALFQERESRDELGLGGVRDSFADRLFPGTSTIQTLSRNRRPNNVAIHQIKNPINNSTKGCDYGLSRTREAKTGPVEAGAVF